MRRRLIALVLGSYSLVGWSLAQDDLGPVREKGEAERKAILAKLKSDLSEAQDNKDPARKKFLLELFQKQIQEIEKAKDSWWPTLLFEEGSRGVVRGWVDLPGKWGPFSPVFEVKVFRVIDPSTILVQGKELVISISNVDTKNLADDVAFKPTGLFRYLGTKKYGASTYYAIERIPPP